MLTPLSLISLSMIGGMAAAAAFSFWIGLTAGATALIVFIVVNPARRIMVVLCAVAALTGFLRMEIALIESAARVRNEPFPSGIVQLRGTVQGDTRETPTGLAFEFRCRAIYAHRRWVPYEKTFLASIEKTNGRLLEHGDPIEGWGRIQPFAPTHNRGIEAFEERMMENGTAARFFFVPGGWKISGPNVANPLSQLVHRSRGWLGDLLPKILPPHHAALLGSLLFGTRTHPLPLELQDVFRKAGIVHLLVVSGQQVALLAGMILSACRLASIPMGAALPLTSLATLFFSFMVGGGAAVERATIMAEISLAAKFFQRDAEWMTSLSIAALVILLLDPTALTDPGFQFSFAATWALIAVVPVFEERLASRLPEWLAAALALGVAPTLCTLPITLFHFGELHLISFLANLVAIPLVELVVPLGFLLVLLGAVWLPIAQLLGGTMPLMLDLLESIARFCSSVPGFSLSIPSLSALMAIALFGAIVLLVELLRRKTFPKATPYRAVAFCLCLCSLLLWDSALSSNESIPWARHPLLKVTVLDVGQGDSILIEPPSGADVLVDGGKRPMGRQVVLPVLRRHGIQELSLVVLTHPHEDHVGGLVDVLDQLKVDCVLDGGQIASSESYSQFMGYVVSKKIPYRLGRPGQVIQLGQGVRGEVLSPELPFLQNTNSDLNNNSISIRLVYGRIKILLTGDLENEGETRLLQSGAEIDSEILKAGHHGSRTSSSEDFLNRVHPRVAIISCGLFNRYHHPSPSTLRRYADHGIQTFRTDLQGAIEIETDGTRYSVRATR